jgi:pilus assembly protein FimV
VRKLPSRKLLATLIAGALFIPQSGFSLGLGEIEVDSSLNQKLKAEIELLSATPEDTETLIVKLASRKEFIRAGIDRPYSLNDLRFESEVIDDIPHIKITSGSPIREPFLNFLVEVDWPNGHLLREYTILLDPPVFMMNPGADTAESRPAPASAESRPASGSDTSFRPSAAVSAPSASIAAQPAQPATTAAPQQPGSSTAFIPAPVVQQQTPQPALQQAVDNKPPGSYRIKKGDTAWSLADDMRPDRSVTVPQMMFAILKKNPEAFNRENVNGLKRGYILRMPDSSEIAAISKADAQAMMNEHWALWRQYQQAQSGAQPVTAMQAESPAAGGVSDTAAGSDDARLAIVSAGTGASTAGSKDPTQMTAEELRAELALARERVETERVEKEALQQRIESLEQNLAQSPDQREGLLTVEDKELSDVQSLNAPAGEAADISVSEQAAADQATAAETDMTDQALSEHGMAEKPEAEAGSTQETEQTAATDPETAAANDAIFADEVADQEGVAQELAEQAAVEPVAEQNITEQDAVSPPVRESAAASDPLTQILNNPMLLAAAGGGLLLIAALIALIIKRRKTGSDDNEMKSGFADLEDLADDLVDDKAGDSVADEAGEEAVDGVMAGDQVLDEAVAESDDLTDGDLAEPEKTTVAEADEEEPASRDDVIAEADVYLAYGIYQQAEELLKTAISENPDKIDYQLKLAETHFASKNAEAFVEVAGGIRSKVEADSAEWQKVMTMGQELCADNPMFQGELSDPDSMESAAGDGPMDLDFNADETESASEPEAEVSAEAEELELPEMEAGDETDDVITGSAEEIEFDISDTGAIDEAAASEEFALDIDATELDIEDENSEEVSGEDVVEESLDLTDVDIGLDDDEPVAEQVTEEHADQTGDTDIEFDLDEGKDSSAEVAEFDVAEMEEIAEIDDADLDDTGTLDLSDEAAELDIDMGEEVVSDESADEEVIEDNNIAELEIPDVAEAAEDTDEDAAAAVTAANDGVTDEGDFDLSSLDDVDEVSTKLDLARAYLDMGDHDGSRDILQEVLADGNDEQKQEANDLMKKLA